MFPLFCPKKKKIIRLTTTSRLFWTCRENVISASNRFKLNNTVGRTCWFLHWQAKSFSSWEVEMLIECNCGFHWQWCMVGWWMAFIPQPCSTIQLECMWLTSRCHLDFWGLRSSVQRKCDSPSWCEQSLVLTLQCSCTFCCWFSGMTAKSCMSHSPYKNWNAKKHSVVPHSWSKTRKAKD